MVIILRLSRSLQFLVVCIEVALTLAVSGPAASESDAKRACETLPSQVRVELCADGGSGKIVSMMRNQCRSASGAWRTVIDTCASSAQPLRQGLCVDCVAIRVGPPGVVRGPFRDELDTFFSVLALPDGRYRGFSSNANAYAIDGSTPLAMRGNRTLIASRGSMGPGSECGNWLVSTIKRPDALYGLFHVEGACDRSTRQTNKSVAIATSNDDGLHWTLLGPIISSAEPPRHGAITGIGDCTAVDGRDGYVYAYCLRARDWRTIVARSPLNDLTPGSWRQWDGHNWSQPGINGEGASLGITGTSAGWWNTAGAVVLLGEDQWFGGLRMWISRDKITFLPVADPILNFEANNWTRPVATSVQAYPSIVNPKTGGNSFENTFLLTYTYVPEGKTFKERYLIQHRVALIRMRERMPVQVERAIASWRDRISGIRTTSSSPMMGNFELERVIGYELTRPLPGDQSNEIFDCRGQGALPSFVISNDCAELEFGRIRTAGWLQRRPTVGSIALYLCRSPQGQLFNSVSDYCDGHGIMESKVGYMLP